MVSRMKQTNALFTPTFPQNIFSAQTAVENGSKMNFCEDGAVLLHEES